MRPAKTKQTHTRHNAWIRFAIKSFLAVLLVGIPALFPDSVKAIQEHRLSPALILFAVIMVAVAVWDVVDKNTENRKEQEQEVREQEAAAQSEQRITDLQVKLKDAQFAEEYTDALAKSINAIQYLSGYGPRELDIAIRSFLETVQAVVALSLRDADSLELNASVMRPVPFSEEQCQRLGSDLFFLDPNRTSTTYEQILITTHWASDNHIVPDNFSLPVHRKREQLLFGAPDVFKKGSPRHVADITDNEELSRLIQNQTPEVQSAIRAFFQGREYRSFASIRLEYGARTIGVMNISSNHPKAFENVVNKEDSYQRYIRPLAAMASLALTYKKEM